MKRRGLQLSRLHKSALYGTSLFLLVSGALWSGLQQMEMNGSLIEPLRLIKSQVLKFHGIAAVGFVFLLGTLWQIHIRRAWRANINRLNGAPFFGLLFVLTISGYALYYLGDETWRRWTSMIHLVVGLVSPVLLVIHILMGRRAVEKRSKMSSTRSL